MSLASTNLNKRTSIYGCVCIDLQFGCFPPSKTTLKPNL